MDAIDQCRHGFTSGRTRPLEWRRQQLDMLERLIIDNKKPLIAALASDLQKPETEAWGTDLRPTIEHIRHLKKNLTSWSKPRRVNVPLIGQPGKAYSIAEPLGVCLILAPWNYPVFLLCGPIASAIAAGNAVVAKPSELAPTTTKLLAELAANYLDPEAIQVIEGGPEVASELLTHKFDHIFFTGSTRVGRLVSQAAAKFLTPTTLELGGKSPVIVDATANVAEAAKRIAWGKFINAGQSCIAPDYVLVQDSVKQKLLDELDSCIKEFYGSNPKASPDYGRILDSSNVVRLADLLETSDNGTIVSGGESEIETNYVAPTIVVDPQPDSPILSDEIFGPILPVLGFSSLDDAISVIVEKPKPLALYIFSTSEDAKKTIMEQTSSGTVVVNHTMFQLAMPDLPFGGVGESGQGRHQGRRGFERFSNMRSVVEKPEKYELDLIYPSNSKWKSALLRRLLS